MLRRVPLLVVSSVLLGCAAPGTTAEPTRTPEASPPVPPKTAPVAAPELPADEVAAPPAQRPAEVAPAPDPARLSGYVQSREATRGIPAQFTATVTAVDHAPGEGMGTWRFTFKDSATAASYDVKVEAPAALSPPLRVGDVVHATVGSIGGGPNFYLTLIFTADDGGLLLAVNAAPNDWKVSRGKAGSVDRGSDYSERRYGVKFEHGDVRISVAEGAWARVTIGPATYYVWGSAAQRKLRAGKRPMPDYVGGWLDFAVIRVHTAR